jgi:hypothetical protein
VLGVEIPPAIETALLRSLAKKPDARFQTARDFRKALEQVLKDSDVGLAETQRLARSSTPPAFGGPTVPITPRAQPAKASSRSPDGSRGPDVTGLADRLEPSTSMPQLRRRRAGVWLALGALVAVGAAGVAFLMLRAEEEPAKAQPSRQIDAAEAPKDEAFLPPGLKIVATESARGGALTVHVSNDWAPSEVTHVWGQTLERFERFAREKGVTASLPSPMTVVIVPSRVMCDDRTYEEKNRKGAAPANCDQLGNFYRPLEQTLLVVDDRTKLPVNLGVGMAEAACLTSEGACELVASFEQLLRSGS